MIQVKKFFDMYDNYETKKNIKTAVTQFYKSIYPETTSENMEEINQRYFSTERDIEDDIRNFLKYLNGLAPLSIKLKLSIAKTFLTENDVELPQKFWKRINRLIKGSRALTLDRIPTKAEFKRLLMHMPIQGKALNLVLESSGMRIGEALNSNIDDLYLEEKPARIQIRGEITKTGNSRHAFISSEAKEALTEWLKVREDYLRAAVRKSQLYPKSGDDPRIFPFEPRTAYSIWTKALHKSGLNGKDKSTNRERIHPHVLRKFFRTRLGAVIPVDVVEALMGHEGYLTEVYRRYTVEDLAKFYLQGESALLVFTDAAEVTKLRQEVDERSKVLQTLVNGLTTANLEMKTENLEIKSKVAKVELENTDFKKRVQKTEEKLTEIMELLQESLKQSGHL
ncbi:tyrosine-type recombinase/integrase [Candidatus Bathyarchaeota archaeon]|nr:tyrosine-type recombinase/integrase [Candidatus Bathyarchaeota archaeon]